MTRSRHLLFHFGKQAPRRSLKETQECVEEDGEPLNRVQSLVPDHPLVHFFLLGLLRGMDQSRSPINTPVDLLHEKFQLDVRFQGGPVKGKPFSSL